MENGRKLEEKYVNVMIDAIVAVMPRMPVRDRQKMYRFAYTQCIVNPQRGNAGFVKEAMPPVPELTSRVKVMLREADGDDVRRVFKMMRTLVEMRRIKKE